MLAKRIIPCLDVKEGRVVKGVNFEGLRDAGDPVDCAAAYDEMGADEICFLDITASKEARGTLLDAVERTAERAFVPLTVGGGVGSVEDVRDLLRAGADKVSMNSAALKDPSLIDRAAGVPVIAAGGVSRMSDIERLLPLEKDGVIGAVVGRAIYEGTLDLKEALARVNA